MKLSDSLLQVLDEAIQSHGENVLRHDRHRVFSSISAILKFTDEAVVEARSGLHSLENTTDDLKDNDMSSLEKALIDEASVKIKESRSDVKKPLDRILQILKSAQQQLQEYVNQHADEHDPGLVLLEGLKNSNVLSKSVEILNLSIRGRKRMVRGNIKTLGELVAYTADELLHGKEGEPYKTKMFGATSLLEVRCELAKLGLALKGETPEKIQ